VHLRVVRRLKRLVRRPQGQRRVQLRADAQREPATHGRSQSRNEFQNIGDGAQMYSILRVQNSNNPLQYSTVHHYTVQYYTLYYTTVQCSAVQNSTVQFQAGCGVPVHVRRALSCWSP